MTTNMHALDRTVRLIVALALLLAAFAGWLSGAVAVAIAVLAAILLITSALGFCPLYRLFGISTCTAR